MTAANAAAIVGLDDMKRYFLSLCALAAATVLLFGHDSLTGWMIASIFAWPFIVTGFIEYMRFLRER